MKLLDLLKNVSLYGCFIQIDDVVTGESFVCDGDDDHALVSFVKSHSYHVVTICATPSGKLTIEVAE